MRSDLYKEKLSGELLLLIAGGNDLKSLSTNKDRKTEIVKNCLENIEAMVTNHQSSFKKIVILSIPPAFEIPVQYKPLYSKIIDEAHLEINSRIEKLSKTHSLILLDAYKILNNHGKFDELSDDGIHMNDKAYSILESELGRYLAVSTEGQGH